VRCWAPSLHASKAETKALDLSGGERARLLLSMVAREAPHLLILDEPTNHLDIDSRRALLDALNTYEGAVVLITHDRSLMELVADRLWLTADGEVKPFDGDMDDYARLVLDRSRAASRAESGPKGPSGKEARKAAAEARAKLAPLKKTADTLEAKIDKLTRLIAAQNEMLEDEDLDPVRVIDIGREQARAEKQLAAAEAEWLAAAEAYETAKAQAAA
jgi:ATP-binding cassette subfamily F protein 3